MKLGCGEAEPSTTRILQVDGWRSLFTLLIVLGHSRLSKFVPGGLGVTALFVASGFTIAFSLLSSPISDRRDFLLRYSQRRVRNIFLPVLLYLFVAAVFLVVVAGRANFGELATGLGPTGNYYKIFVTYERIGDAPSPAHVLWPISILQHCYLIFIPLIWTLRNRKRLLMVLILLLCFGPLLVRVILLSIDAAKWLELDYIYAATETRIDSFAWGCLAAWFVTTRAGKARVNGTWLAVGAFGLLIGSLAIRRPEFRETVRYSVQNLALCLLLIAGITSSSNWWKEVLSVRPLVLFGNFAYSTFLYHWFAVVAATVLFGTQRSGTAWQLVYWPLTFIMALVSHTLISSVERRMRSAV
jgi:peptidoglycan/LPS O-acetylase OafA/YrhL